MTQSELNQIIRRQEVCGQRGVRAEKCAVREVRGQKNTRSEEERRIMSILSEELQARKKDIAKRIKELEISLQNAPESRLRVSMNKGNPRFYEVADKGDTTGMYLGESLRDRARMLAQSDYEKKVLSMLQKERKLLDALAGFYEQADRIQEGFFSGPEELIPMMMIKARREMIVPVAPDQNAYTENWLADRYELKGFPEGAPEYYTGSGIRVRSKTEWMIAEMLEKEKIPFYYERPLNLHGLGTIHPDFTVLNRRYRKTYFWEHMGMLDDESYRNHALNRIEYYILNGYLPGRDLILTFETSTKPIRSKIIESIIAAYFLE